MTRQSLTIIKPHKIGSFSFDTTFFERHQAEIRLTKQPIELGADITDHAFVEPIRVVIGAAVADVPLKPNPSFDKSTSVARSSSAYQAVLTAMFARQLITVQTGLANYPNMIMETLDVMQDKNSPDLFNFILTLQQIRIVSLTSVAVPAQFLQPGKMASDGSTTVNNGNQLPQALTPVQVSTLAKWFGKPYPTASTQ